MVLFGPRASRDIDHRESKRFSDLRSGESHAGGVVECFDHVVDQSLELCVPLCYLFGDSFENGVGVEAYREDGHKDLKRDGIDWVEIECHFQLFCDRLEFGLDRFDFLRFRDVDLDHHRVDRLSFLGDRFGL